MDVERFGIKKLQEEFEYTNLVLQRIGDIIEDETPNLKKEEKVYQLHYVSSSVISLMRPYIEQGMAFNGAFEIAYDAFKIEKTA